MDTDLTAAKESLVEHILAVIADAACARRNHDYEKAQRLLSEASRTAFGIEHRELLFLSVAELCEQLRTPDRIRACAKLVLAEAQLTLDAGNWDQAERLQMRAMGLIASADARGGPTEFPSHA